MIKTEHKGYMVHWSDNEDKWTCSQIGFSHASLAKVKDRINKLMLDLRKKSSVPALMVEVYGSTTEVTIIEYLGVAKGRYGDGGAHRVAVMVPSGGAGGGMSRRTVSLNDLALTGEANERIASEVAALRKEATDASAKASSLQNTYAKVSLDHIAGLVAAAAGGDEDA